MKRHSDYKLITEHSLSTFNSLVSGELRKGWTLRGRTRIIKTGLASFPLLYTQELVWES